MNFNKIVKEETYDFLKADVIQERIIKELESLLAEGVGDKAAEKLFNVPDPNTEMERQAMRGMKYLPQDTEEPQENEMGELAGRFVGSKTYDFYKNPKSLRDFEKNVRAISDTDGDLFVAQMNGFFFHGDMADYINNMGEFHLERAYNQLYNITWHRVGDTNTFGLSISHMEVMEDDRYYKIITKQLDAVRKKNPNFKFLPYHWTDINENNFPENGYTKYIASLSTNEGVADVYAEKEFNIPNDYRVSDVKASSYVQQQEEEPVGRYGNTLIYQNPKSLENFDTNVRAVAYKDGNLYVAQENSGMLHGELAVGAKLTNDTLDAYHGDKEDYALLHRIGETNKFGFGDSGIDYFRYQKKAIIDTLRKTKEKNPQYQFYLDYFQKVNSETPEIDSYVDAEIGEGVADKYAEKEFNIPDPNAEMEKKAMKGIKDSSMGELVGVIRNEWIDMQGVEHSSETNVYMNPKTLQNFDEDVRAITDEKGNLFIGQLDSDYWHGELANAVERQHPEYDLTPAYGELHKKILWHRVGLSREFGFSISYKDYLKTPDGMKRAGELLEAAQRKNPQFEFVLEYWQGM